MADAKSQYPLPDGVRDAILNRGQIARALDVSEPTIDRWIADGMPVYEQGGNGKSYKFQLSDCWAWKCARDHDEALATEESERTVQQMRLALIGGAAGDSERALSPKERAELYEAEYRWSQAAKARGELTPIQRVEDLMEEVMATVRDTIVALPDRLQRECNLQNRQVEKAVIACDDALNEAVRKLDDGLRSLQQGARPNGHSLELQ